MYFPFQPFVLALANRCRGGLVDIPSGQLGRLVLWAIPLTAVLICCALDVFLELKWYWQIAYALLLTGANFLGACLPAWGKYDQDPVQYFPLAVEGLKFFGPGALVCVLMNPWISLALIWAAWLMPVCYELGWKIPSKIKGFEQGTPLGEWFTGLAAGAMIYIALLLTS